MQQAFVKAQVERLATLKSKVLCVGYNSDTAYFALKKKGYDIEGIDPLYNMDLDGFYQQWDKVTRYDLIFSTS